MMHDTFTHNNIYSHTTLNKIKPFHCYIDCNESDFEEVLFKHKIIPTYAFDKAQTKSGV